MKAFILLFGLLSIAGCATTPKHYMPPDSTGMEGARVRIEQSVAVAVAAAKKSRQAVEQVKTGVNLTAAKAQSAGVKLVLLAKVAPPELRPQIASVQGDVDSISLTQRTMQAELGSASTNQADLDKRLSDAMQAQVELATRQAEYENEASILAVKASAENEARIKAETALSWYRWHWWGSWIALGAGMIACGVFAFLKWTGRLAMAGGGIASKF